MLVYFLLDIACVGQLHYYTQGLSFLVEKGLPVVDYVGMGDGREDANFV